MSMTAEMTPKNDTMEEDRIYKIDLILSEDPAADRQELEKLTLEQLRERIEELDIKKFEAVRKQKPSSSAPPAPPAAVPELTEEEKKARNAAMKKKAEEILDRVRQKNKGEGEMFYGHQRSEGQRPRTPYRAHVEEMIREMKDREDSGEEESMTRPQPPEKVGPGKAVEKPSKDKKEHEPLVPMEKGIYRALTSPNSEELELKPPDLGLKDIWIVNRLAREIRYSKIIDQIWPGEVKGYSREEYEAIIKDPWEEKGRVCVSLTDDDLHRIPIFRHLKCWEIHEVVKHLRKAELNVQFFCRDTKGNENWIERQAYICPDIIIEEWCDRDWRLTHRRSSEHKLKHRYTFYFSNLGGAILLSNLANDQFRRIPERASGLSKGAQWIYFHLIFSDYHGIERSVPYVDIRQWLNLRLDIKHPREQLQMIKRYLDELREAGLISWKTKKGTRGRAAVFMVKVIPPASLLLKGPDSSKASH